MGQIIYSNNEVEIIAEVIDEYDTKINVNNENLIWISAPEIGEFKKELSAVLDKYRILFKSDNKRNNSCAQKHTLHIKIHAISEQKQPGCYP